MSGIKISALPTASALTGVEMLPVVQSGVTCEATVTQLFTSPTISSPSISSSIISGFKESTTDIGTVTTSYQLNISASTLLIATLTASQTCVFAMPLLALAGNSFTLLLNQASGANGAATFTGVKWSSAGAPTITVTASKRDILCFIYDGTAWYGNYSQGYTP
jgi:hypothetical protein